MTSENYAARRRGGIPWTKRPTAQDVADIARVSAQTVSRVANNSPNVRPATRERVLQAMNKIGYAPNEAARSLRAGRSATIGLVAHSIGRTGETQIIKAVSTTARAHGYALALADAPDGSAPSLNTAIRQLHNSVAGVVLLGLEGAAINDISIPPTLPVAIADSRALRFPTVGFDQTGGAQLAVAHLLGFGHRTVHLLGGPADSLAAQERQAGWQATLKAAGREIPQPLIGDWTPASGYELGRKLAEQPDVTAIFAANDEMAAGLMRALHEAERAIPGDVSVVGFDDLIAEYLWPPLTSIRHDFAAVGENLIRLLMSQIDPGRMDDHPEPIMTLVPPNISVRASSGPVASVAH